MSSSPFSSSYSAYESDSNITWVERFLSRPELQQLLIQIPVAYLEESLSLYGLDSEIKYFQEAYNLIIYDQNDGTTKEMRGEIENAASILYAKAHQRYVKTAAALSDVQQNYLSGIYGTCPRVQCRQQHLLPYGASNNSGKCILRGFCPNCKELYKIYINNRNYYIDGCFFGPDFVGMFLMTYPQYVIKKEDESGDLARYVPKACGLEIYNKLLQKHKVTIG